MSSNNLNLPDIKSDLIGGGSVTPPAGSGALTPIPGRSTPPNTAGTPPTHQYSPKVRQLHFLSTPQNTVGTPLHPKRMIKKKF